MQQLQSVLIGFVSVASLAACTVTTSAGTSGGSGGAAASTVDPSLLGGFCSNVGEEDGKVFAFGQVKDCAAGVCVADGNRHVTEGGSDRIDTYCTASCDTDACPAAWDCVTNDAGGDGSPNHVCVKQAAVCGDGVKQVDEACEDGNTDDMDGCNSTCTKVLPASIHAISFTGKVHEETGDNLPLSRPFFIVAASFPRVADDGGGFAIDGSITNVTPDSFEVTLGAENNDKQYGYLLDVILPRQVGKPESLAGLKGYWVSYSSPALPTSSVEVTAAHADGRSYEAHVHFESEADTSQPGSGTVTIDSVFVVTLPP